MLLSLSTTYVDDFLSKTSVSPSVITLTDAHKSLQNKTCKGSEYLWWIDFPEDITDERIIEIQNCANKIIANTDVFIVCGIGGSYLGTRAIIEAFSDPRTQNTCEFVYLGNHLSAREYERIFHKYSEKRISACVISKSGTTLETAISYRLVRDFLLSKYSEEEVKTRIFTVTDRENGALREESDKQWYQSYVLPGNIGGRYSVMTPVWLFPCAIAGIDILWLIHGARKARMEILWNQNHPAFVYAQKRVNLEQSGFVSELFITSEPSLYFIWEWWKQLMGESHGKEWKWLYPDTLSYTTDLHSLWQYVQEGRRLFFETMLWIKNMPNSVRVPPMNSISDGLETLVGRDLHELNLIALESTAKAHCDGGCPSMVISLDILSAESMGYFLYTMMFACALSGIMMGANPFDQPGVEAYKREMRKRLL
jgi:glucose-6-phosphate isomerase